MLLLAGPLGASAALTQTQPKGAHAPKAGPETAPTGAVRLLASLAPADTQGVKAGIVWRVFDEQVEADGTHKLVAESREAAPTIIPAPATTAGGQRAPRSPDRS